MGSGLRRLAALDVRTVLASWLGSVGAALPGIAIPAAAAAIAVPVSAAVTAAIAISLLGPCRIGKARQIGRGDSGGQKDRNSGGSHDDVHLHLLSPLFSPLWGLVEQAS
jgi:hypothetical protein